MPVYKYRCDNCGFEQEQFLHADKTSVPMTCKRCQRKTIAYQDNDPNIEYREKDDVQGVLRHEETGV